MLYVDDPVPELKRQLVAAILELTEDVNPALAGPVLGVDEARMSDLAHGRHARFSLQRLIRMLANVDRRVMLEVSGRTPVRWFLLRRGRPARRR
ncbi:MAG: XRE family transcriptional regulator [Gemmatimonadales bacterium]